MSKEATLVLIKPDAAKKGLTGIVLSRLDVLQLEIVGAKVIEVSRELAEEHYKHIRGKPFFEETVEYIQGKLHGVRAILAFVFYGENAVERIREVAGATNPEKAGPTSIRGSMGRITTSGLMENLLHASSDASEAKREIQLWFSSKELRMPTGTAI
ncbi:MAG: nucleoside-diphosphate kinase [Candidatus Omnitrophica bacterium]|nr:nucleoside-diphosphate kinase [Candidatus Omnitrophota bacterium]